MRAAKRGIKAAQGLVLVDDLKARRKVLRRLGFVDSEGVVTLKARAAQHSSSASHCFAPTAQCSTIHRSGCSV